MKRFGTTNRDSDPSLMARVGEGDPGAINELYDRHARRVYALLVRIVSDRQSAEDLLQEVFLRAWDRADTYRESEGRVLPWILSVAHNLAINELRRRGRRPQHAPRHEGTQDDDPYLRLPEGGPDPSDQAWDGIRRERVERAMAALPESQRQVLDLYAIGYSQSEIAVRLNEPLGTVKSRMRRGLGQLRERLTAEGIGPA